MTITRHSPQPCPAKCGYIIDSAGGVPGQNYTPRAGDFTVCINCCAVLIFTKKLKLRLSSLEEAEKLGYAQEIKRLIAAIKISYSPPSEET